MERPVVDEAACLVDDYECEDGPVWGLGEFSGDSEMGFRRRT